VPAVEIATAAARGAPALELARGVGGVRRVASEIESPDRLSDYEIWRDPGGAPDAPVTATDLWITGAAKVRLLAAGVSAMDVNVDTRGGIVTLFGTIPSEEAKRTAEAEVTKVGGTSAVRNMQVVPEGRREVVRQRDEEIRERVEQRLSGRGDLADADLDVEVADGVVRLSVESQTDRLAALTVARTHDGVRSVVGEVRVERE
jgi:osmotically-inducible protein OsmY